MKFEFKTPLLLFLRYYRMIGLRVTLYALLAVIVAVFGPYVEVWLGDLIQVTMGRENVMPVLTILATSMLAVSTFSLNVMVTAHRAASESATPRVHKLLREDTTTQSVISTFIGAFVFALTSIIFFQAGLFPEETAVVVMASTILVVLLVIVAMLRWIEHLSRLGSLDNSLEIAVSRARVPLLRFARSPALGGKKLSSKVRIPKNGRAIKANRSGYIQIIKIDQIQDCLPEDEVIYALKGPGSHVLEGETIARIGPSGSDALLGSLTDCFLIGETRTFEQDPEFGLIVLSEIASKALSPSVNDPGTAIAVIANIKELMWAYAQTDLADEEVDNRVYLSVSDETSLLDAGFTSIARDGASKLEVLIELRQALNGLAKAPKLTKSAGALDKQLMAFAKSSALLKTELVELQKAGPSTDR